MLIGPDAIAQRMYMAGGGGSVVVTPARRVIGLVVLSMLWGCAAKPRIEAVPRPAVPSAGVVQPGGFYYTVRQGDTLISIANSYNVAASSIMKANRLQDQYAIRAGQRLLIPAVAAVPPTVGKIPDLSRIVSEPNFTWPLRGRVIKRFTAEGNDTEHSRGIIISARQGEPVLAAMSGVVTFASEAFQGYGRTVLIRHANNVSTFYAYNSRLLVSVGDSVRQGQPIAEAGQSGRAGGPQLLFRILHNEEPLDPLRYLP